MINASLQAAKAVAVVNEAKTDLATLKKATDGTEAFMFKSLLQSAGGKKGLFSANVPGAEIYRDMFEQNLSDVMAQRGTLHISDTIFNKVAPLALAQAKTRLRLQTIEKKA